MELRFEVCGSGAKAATLDGGGVELEAKYAGMEGGSACCCAERVRDGEEGGKDGEGSSWVLCDDEEEDVLDEL